MTKSVRRQTCTAVIGAKRVKISTADGDDYIFQRIVSTGSFYERDVLEEISRLPMQEGNFCDVGANIGNHTLYFACVMNRDVIAFEPLSQCYDQLAHNVALNHCEDQVKLHNLALGAESGVGRMVTTPGNLGASQFIRDEAGEVRLATLDDTLDATATIALIKIDVEGYELEVLKGAKATISKHKPVLVIEARDVPSFVECQVFLRRTGYIPVGTKGQTATVFFIHEGRWDEYQRLSGFLTRIDIDASTRKLVSYFSRLSKSLETVPCKEDMEVMSTNLEVQVHSVTEQLRSELASVGDTFDEKIRECSRSIEELPHARQRIASLEDTVSKLRVSVQTERARGLELSRRLQMLYTTGVRPVVGSLLRVANVLSFGTIKPYESWEQYQARLRARVDKDVVNYKSINAAFHAKPKSTTPRYATAQPNLKSKALSPSVGATPAGISSSGILNERVRVGIASIANRSTALKSTVESLYDQVDELVIYLNDYAEIPAFLDHEKIRVIHNQGDIGDRGKFYAAEEFDGYFLSCDDDIEYPPYYVRHCIDGIERYGRKAVVGWHGSLIKEPFDYYYTAESRRVLSFRSGRPEDVAVHILGTGCAAFHTSTMGVKLSDFLTANMADVYFALLGQRHKIPFVVLKHDPAQATPIDIPDDRPIHRESMQSSGSKADTGLLQNSLVKEWGAWQAIAPPLVYQRDLRTIAYVGRLDTERWKKGGILKSGNLLVNALRRLGHRVLPVEITQSFNELSAAVKGADVVWIYPGDPERPDFESVESLIGESAEAGKQVYVNLSYNLRPSRTAWIVNRLREWKSNYGTRVKACLFTYSALQVSDLQSVRSNLVCIPKSVEYDRTSDANFGETEGIFLGDLQKLINRELVGGDIEEWIDAVREQLPYVPLYAVRQYGGVIDRELPVEVVPYTQGVEWESWLSERRIVACLTPYATFEMIPIEAAGLRIPVVYRPMIQSQTESLSVSGIQVSTPEEFAQACKMLYTDPVLWTSYGTAGRYRALSQHIDFVASAIHVSLVIGAS